jgi:acetoin utilization protein AcuB
MIVANRMKRDPVWVDEGDSMKKAMDLLKEHEIRHLPVLKDGEKLVGILSKDINASPLVGYGSEIRRSVYLIDKKVKQIMTRRPYTFLDDPLEEAALIIGREDRIPAGGGQRNLVGIIRTDTIDAFIEGRG